MKVSVKTAALALDVHRDCVVVLEVNK